MIDSIFVVDLYYRMKVGNYNPPLYFNYIFDLQSLKLVKASLTSGEEIEAERLIVFSHAVSLTLALCVMTICMFASLILVYF
jgi:hypothetical protein